MTKLRLIKGKLKKWNVEVFGNMRLKKQSLLRRIKELDTLEPLGMRNNQLKEERYVAKTILEKAILEEDRALQMKSKFTWAREGDANTKLFHSLLNARKAKNVITKLELDDGSFVDSEDDIVREITGFFQKLYKTEGSRFRGIESFDWQTIAQHLADWLEKPVEEEVKKAILDFYGNKAPGLDGFTLEMF